MNKNINTAKLVELYNQKKSIYSIAVEMDMTQYSVTKALKKLGIEVKRRKPDRAIRQAIINDWRAGIEKQIIMDKYYISESGLWSLVKGLKRKRAIKGWIKPDYKETPVVLTSFPKIKGRDYGGGVNIYKNTSGRFYYSKSPYSQKDRKVESGISADFAFDTVGRWNGIQ